MNNYESVVFLVHCNYFTKYRKLSLIIQGARRLVNRHDEGGKIAGRMHEVVPGILGFSRKSEPSLGQLE